MSSGRLPPTCRSALISVNSAGTEEYTQYAIAEFMRISADVDCSADKEDYHQMNHCKYYYNHNKILHLVLVPFIKGQVASSIHLNIRNRIAVFIRINRLNQKTYT